MDVQLNDPDLDPTVAELLKDIDPELLKSSEGRRALCEFNPLLFALVYLDDSLRDTKGNISFADCHLTWAELAKNWAIPVTGPYEHRYALLAPRGTGKSTFFYLILPIFWAAYGYSEFITAFASSHKQAQRHLDSFKAALRDPKHKALKMDFPELCKPKRSTEGLYIAKSGFAFVAQGADSASLGMKIGNRRPDTLLLDDIEDEEGSYSTYLAEQRLITLQDGILPLETMARVVLTGTTTMAGSITHQLVKYAKGQREPELNWVGIERFKVVHSLPILTDDAGNQRSFWPGNPKFQLEDMLLKVGTREWSKNYLNDPMSSDSQYWRSEDFHYADFECTNTMISIDGAVTTGAKSDFTGIAVVGYASPAPHERMGKCLVKEALGMKLKGNALREKVLRLIEVYPEVNGVLVETNQGGDMWLEVLHNLPVPVVTIHQTDKKETRAGRALTFYQLADPRVYHKGPLGALEEQMVNFPKVPHDDILDAVVTGVLAYLRPVKRTRAKARTISPR